MKRAVVVVLAAASLLALVAPPAAADGRYPGELALLQRLFSPCCYRETLDAHASPIATELQVEIHERLGRGESADAIVASMVARFGEEVLTKPPHTATAFGLFAGTGLFVTVLIVLALRRNRRVPAADDAPTERGIAGEDRQRLQDRLEDELGTLD